MFARVIRIAVKEDDRVVKLTAKEVWVFIVLSDFGVREKRL
jgi:hypothetical protein